MIRKLYATFCLYPCGFQKLFFLLPWQKTSLPESESLILLSVLDGACSTVSSTLLLRSLSFLLRAALNQMKGKDVDRNGAIASDVC